MRAPRQGKKPAALCGARSTPRPFCAGSPVAAMLFLAGAGLMLLLSGEKGDAGPVAKLADDVIRAYVNAIGGQAAVDRIETRETQARERHGPKLTYYWQKPDKVLLIEGKRKVGYDGGSGWMLSKKKHVTKLPKGAQKPLEIDANPIRYAQLKQLYPEVQAAAPEIFDERKMDVLIAPNDLGSTKLYFEQTTHLLARVEETGETSAYFKHATDFADYQEVDGVKLPFRIVHSSTEPGVKPQELRISEVTHNVLLKPDFFNKPAPGAVVLGGKR